MRVYLSSELEVDSDMILALKYLYCIVDCKCVKITVQLQCSVIIISNCIDKIELLLLHKERERGCWIQAAFEYFWPCAAWSLQGVCRFEGFSITSSLLGPTSWFNHIDRSQHAESSRVKRCVFLRIAPYLSCSSSKPNWQRKAKRGKSRENTLSLPAQSEKINLAGY